MTSDVPNTFTVSLTEEAQGDLLEISDLSTRRAILRRLGKLATEPLAQGKPLTGDLSGFRSVRAAGQRYRAVYQVVIDEAAGQVVVVVIGLRREGDRNDAYAVATKRLT